MPVPEQIFHVCTFHVTPPFEATAHPHTNLHAASYGVLIDLLFRSALLHHPLCRLSVMTDSHTDLSAVGVPFTRVEVPITSNALMLDRARAQANFASKLGRSEVGVFLDSDILLNRPLTELLKIDFTVGLTQRRNKLMPINGGVLIARGERPARLRRFFAAYLALFETQHRHEAGWWGDQRTLAALVRPRLNRHNEMYSLKAAGARVLLLPCQDFNYSPPNLPVTAALTDKHILHFKGARKSIMIDYWRDYLAPLEGITNAAPLPDHDDYVEAGSTANPTSILTPYIVPAEISGKKIVNIGDGFILRAIIRQLGLGTRIPTFSPRRPPAIADLSVMANSRTVLLAGANQLNSNYTIWPGLKAATLAASTLRLLPVGLGINGEPDRCDGMSEETAEILRVVHARIEYSSWRCPYTIAYLKQHLPDLADRFLMTGCPVIFDAPLLEGAEFRDAEATIAVTITERGNDWKAREEATLESVSNHFPRSRKVLVLHQNFEPFTAGEGTENEPGDTQRIAVRRYARRLGFEVLAPSSVEEAVTLYDSVDQHFGSRLHAHLLMLSRAKRSFVTRVDDRATGMAEALAFPICDPTSFSTNLDYDFERVRNRVRSMHGSYQRVIGQV